jgi:UDP-2,3-diacylglucosamine hydrolase
MQIPPGKKIYFLSDFHLGAPDPVQSLDREKRIVRFLKEVRDDAAHIFIVGDVFDFWFEYKTVIPKGYTRLLGTLAEITDSGIPVSFFVGNHDMWMKDYFQQEMNIPVYYEPRSFTFNSTEFFIGHGDGLGPDDHSYKFIKKIFRNKACQWLFGVLHPTWGIGLANYFSRRSRAATGSADEKFLGEDREWLILFCRDILKEKHFDYFIFGHRHLPIEFQLKSDSRYINLGDWIRYNSYAVFDGDKVDLKYYGT